MIMNEIKKPNDIFVTEVLNPDKSMLDLVKSGINPENTGFLTLDEYKNTDFAKKAFDKDGTFDNSAFEQSYQKAAQKYAELTDSNFYKNLEKSVEYSPLSRARTATSKTRDVSAEIIKIDNPFVAKKGISSLYGENQSDLSVREMAQNSKIWDTKNNEWMDSTPNDLGLLGTSFNNTLVYAQWDEDSNHYDKSTGREVKHRKGEYKVNDNGDFYTETLGDREVYGKQVLSPLDVLTKDKSFLNNIDFFDSDGKEKSVAGTTFKTIAGIAPYMIPGVNRVWGGITAAVGLTSVLPTFYKSFENIITGEDDIKDQTSLWKTMNSIEGFMSKYADKSMSDKASSNLFSYEQISSMVGDIFGQIHQQRAMASLSKLAGPSSEINEVTALLDPTLKAAVKKQSELAKALNLGYMALVSTADVYSDAVEKGYDRRTAGFAALTSAAGQYAIMMNNPMGDWMLDKTTGYSENVNRSLLKKALKEPMDSFKEAFELMNVNKEEGKKGLALAVSKAKNSIKNVFERAIDEGEVYWKNAIVEGTEEVTEQAVQDATKGIIDVCSSLGWTAKKGSFGGFDNVFSKEGLSNYIMNFAGGLVGGAMFEFQNKKLEPLLSGNSIPKETEYSLLRQIANGETQNLIDEVNRQRKNTGNTNLSPQTFDINGNKVPIASKNGVSEADLIADSTIEYIKMLDGVVNQEGLALKDQDLLHKALINDKMLSMIEADKSGIDKLVLSDFNNLASEIVNLRSKLSEIEKDDTKKGSLEAKNIQNQLEEKRLKVQNIVDGKESEKYVKKTLFYLNPILHTPFINLDKIQYTDSKYKKNYFDLPDSGEGLTKESVTTEFNDYINQPEILGKLDVMIGAYERFQELFSGSFKDYLTSDYSKLRNDENSIYNKNASAQLLSIFKNNPDALRQLSKALDLSGLQNLNLDNVVNYDLYNYLTSNKLIDDSSLSQDEKELVKGQINSYTNLPINQLNGQFIDSIINSINADVLKDSQGKLTLGDNKNTANLPLVSLINHLSTQDKVDNELYLELKNKIDPIFKEAIASFKSKILDLEKSQIAMSDVVFNDSELGKKIKEDEQINDVRKISKEIDDRLLNGESYQDVLDSIKNRMLSHLSDLRTLAKQYEQEGLDEEYNALNYNINVLENYFNNEFDPNLDKSILHSFSEITKNKIKEVNPIYDLLRKLEFTIDGSTYKSVFDLLQDESNILSQSIIDNYLKEGYSYDMIEKGINTLKMAKSIITGMMTKQDLEAPFGFNQSVINYLKQNKEGQNIDKYQVISEQEGIQLYAEFNNLINKLEFLQELSNSNSEAKEKEHIQTREKFNELRLKFFTESSFKYKDKALIPDLDDILNSNESVEQKVIKIETSLYKTFQSLNIDPENYNDFVNEVFSKFLNSDKINEIVGNKSYGLSPNMTSISQYDLFIHLLKCLSVNSTEMQLRIKEVLSNPDFKFAPFFGQEYAAEVAFAMHSNKKLFDSAFEAITLKSNKPFVSIASRIVSILGISGSGKTSATGQYILKYLLQINKDQNILISGPNDNRITALNSALTQTLPKDSGNLTQLNKKNLFDTFVYSENESGEKTSFYDTLEIEQKKLKNISQAVRDDLNASNVLQVDAVDDYDVIHLNKSEESRLYKFKDSLDVTPTAIFIDEVTHFSKFELELLNEVAKKYNISIFTFGDPSQKGYTVSNVKYSIDELFTVSTPYLNSTVRASNIHKKDNNLLLNTISAKLTSLSDKYTGKKLGEAQLEFLNESQRHLKYYQSDNVLHGDKIETSFNISDASLLKTSLLEIRKQVGKENEKLRIITDDGVLPEVEIDLLKQAGFTEDMYEVYSLSNDGKNPVQGQEGELFLSILSGKSTIDNNEIGNFITNLYTATSRALTGSIAIDKGDICKKYNITSKSEKSTFKRDADIDRLMKFKEDRIKQINEITGNSVIDSKVEEKPKPKVDKDIPVESVPFVPSSDPNINVNTLDDLEIKTEENEQSIIGESTSIMMHTFYNRLGVPFNESNQDEYLVDYKGDNKDSDDLQVFRNGTDKIIPRSVIDTFIKLKNIVSLYYDNKKELERNIQSNPQLKSFIEGVLNISTESFISQISNVNLYVVSKKYENLIDKSAFKYENNNRESLQNNQVFHRLVMKINLSNGTKWNLSLAALPKSSTLEKSLDYGKLSKTIVEKYKNFELDVAKKLEESDIIEFKLLESNRKFTSGSQHVSATREKNAPITAISAELLLDSSKTPIPGVFISTVSGKDSSEKYVKIFNGSEQAIISEFNRGFKIKKQFKNNPEVIGRMKGKPFLIVSFDNDQQLIEGKENEFRKVILLSPKSRSFDTMVSEFSELHSNKSLDGKTKGKEQNLLIGKYDGIQLFYAIKKQFSAKDNQVYLEDYLDRLKTSSEAISSNILFKTRGSELINILNKYNSFDEFISDYNNSKKSGSLQDKSNPFSDYFRYMNAGIIILSNYRYLNTFDSPEINTIKEIISDAGNNIPKHYYNAAPSEVDLQENVSYLNTKHLDKFEINIVPEPPRFVVDFDNTLDSYFTGKITESKVSNNGVEITPVVVVNDDNVSKNVETKFTNIFNEAVTDLTDDENVQADLTNKFSKLKSDRLNQIKLELINFEREIMKSGAFTYSEDVEESTMCGSDLINLFNSTITAELLKLGLNLKPAERNQLLKILKNKFNQLFNNCE